MVSSMRRDTVRQIKVSKGAKIKSRYNQVPHPTQDTNGKVTNSQLDTTNESQEFSLFPAGDHKAHMNKRAQRHSKHKTEQKHKRSRYYYDNMFIICPFLTFFLILKPVWSLIPKKCGKVCHNVTFLDVTSTCFSSLVPFMKFI